MSWTPQGVEQAGKGGKRRIGRLALVIPARPAVAIFRILVGASESQRGRARGQMGKTSKSPLAHLPSLFDTLMRPCYLSLLVNLNGTEGF